MRKVLLIFLGLLAGGCSADWYRDSADADVAKILRERETKTLDYEPKVEAETTVSPTPKKSAYVTIPVTPLPPAVAANLEPTRIVLEYAALGPEMKWPAGVVAESKDMLGLEWGRTRATERLRLGPPAPGEETLRLDLFKSLAYGTNHSRAYKTQMEDLYLAALDVTLARHLFEPRPFANAALEYTGGQEDIGYRSAFTVVNSVGLRQQLPYGGEITARALVNFVNAINGNVNDGEQASVALSASVPLLRGAGMVNLEPLIRSEREVVYEIRSFETFRRQFVVTVASAYFRLLTQQQSIANNQYNYDSLKLLTERTRALFAAGILKYIDVQRAEQSQYSAENGLIDAQASYQTALDDFKILLGIPTDQDIEVVAQQLDVTVPQFTAAAAVELAKTYRLELQTQRDRIEDAQRGVSIAKNGLLPDLDLTADGAITNQRLNDAGPSYDLRNDTSIYSAGLRLDLPIDRVAERNVYRRSLIQLERAQREFELQADAITAAARDSVRGIESAQWTLLIQQKGILLAQNRLENSNELLRQGKIDSRELVDAQSDLLEAQDAYDEARANLQIQILRFLRDTGTLRVDPNAGSIGHALNPGLAAVNDRPTGR